MTSLVKSYVIWESPLVLAFLILAILAYRSQRSVALLLLMWASVCYFLPRFAPFVIGLFGYLAGWKNFSRSFYDWQHSWWPLVADVFTFLFLGLIIASLVFFIRERKEIASPHA